MRSLTRRRRPLAGDILAQALHPPDLKSGFSGFRRRYQREGTGLGGAPVGVKARYLSCYLGRASPPWGASGDQ
jgi:hypothetical protein